MNEIKNIADNADMIVNGYAFTKCDMGYRVLNLNNPHNSILISTSGETLETTMDDIEISIVADYYKNNKKFLEEEYTDA
ncbi:MAG: hypothetical protein IIU03_06125 [Bacteroidales bacterium]|nr:hypothetical protein [Bacteroidales bacterium]MBQ5539799.1 hypothetical protein [Bacteroidales bacterium]MEE3446981.1 hypothetical protein [Bacteroidales bacterium]